ncbi:MAG: hypothetical protein J0I09_02625 [Sphingobacteriia bacterium]|nr:hypothetical protein [Sphingobacteriia bacterium]
MNIQNIVALAAQLKAIGFDNMGYSLLKRICLASTSFSICEKLLKAAENVSFAFYFEKSENTETYKLLYYDAILQQESSYKDMNIEGVNVQELDENMGQVDWRKVFDFSEQKSFNPNEKASYDTELKIHQLISALNKLESSEEGRPVSISLKQKYWSDIPYVDLMGLMTNGKSRSDISQRFYFSEGQPVISADEAYRFLLNRWMEKQMQTRKKQQDNDNEAGVEDSGTSNGSGLLKKRRLSNSRNNKKDKAAIR